MANTSLSKSLRHEKLTSIIEENPFLTDEELAKVFMVSVQTIRLDRLELGIPELRERMKQYAKNSYSRLKSLAGQEIIGELLELELEKSGISLLEITRDMVFKKNRIARGHFLFAQANSLAVALVNSEVALTGAAKVIFVKPVKLGERIVAKAVINSKNGNKYNVSVESRSGRQVVFQGRFTVFALDNKEGITVEDCR